MEKGIKVVAVNDPFIDPEYMVSSRRRETSKSDPGVGERVPRTMWRDLQNLPQVEDFVWGVVACSAT